MPFFRPLLDSGDEWHPAYELDHTVEDLVQHPRITVLETKRFQGLTVHKVKVQP